MRMYMFLYKMSLNSLFNSLLIFDGTLVIAMQNTILFMDHGNKTKKKWSCIRSEYLNSRWLFLMYLLTLGTIYLELFALMYIGLLVSGVAAQFRRIWKGVHVLHPVGKSGCCSVCVWAVNDAWVIHWTLSCPVLQVSPHHIGPLHWEPFIFITAVMTDLSQITI